MKVFKSALPEIKLKYIPSNFPNRKVCDTNVAYNTIKIAFDMDLINYREEFVCLFLNRANNTVGYMKIGEGDVSATVVNTPMLFVTALQCGASNIIIAHNHPSGRLIPSEADDQMTNKIKEGAKLLNISLLDHLIISDKGYYSYQNEGKI